ncbi:MAG: rod shape-determining protein MreC [Ornithinimicrobium sp.]
MSLARKVVLTLLALTVLILVVDLARPSWTAPARAAASAVFSPVQDQLRGWGQDDFDTVSAERDRLAVEVERLTAERDAAVAAGKVDLPAGSGKWRALGARVVAVAPLTSPVGARIVTLDVGSNDGVAADRTVLDAAGLVGRVSDVSPSSADVVLLGDPSVVVAVKFGDEGALGSVSAASVPNLPARDDGQLTLSAVGDSPIRVGDEVSTLGSPGDTPYTADIAVGVVSRVDEDTGQLGSTAVVQPYVDVDTIDAVVVLVRDGG